MSRVALIVEGPGDISAFPNLVSRLAVEFGFSFFASEPIKAAGLHRLRQPGQLERYVALGMSHPDVSSVVVAIDLDDGCVLRVKEELEERRIQLAVRFGRRVELVFCLREYEAWFLSQLENLRHSVSEYDWDEGFVVEDATAIRDAKGAVRNAIGRSYKETIDQLKLTRGLDLSSLYRENRSFRRLVKALSGMEYGELSPYFE